MSTDYYYEYVNDTYLKNGTIEVSIRIPFSGTKRLLIPFKKSENGELIGEANLLFT